MAYTSAFTGAQMDAVFRRVTNTVVGRASIEASGGAASIYVDVPGFTNPYCFATIRFTDIPLSKPIAVYCSYISNTERLRIRLVGDSIIAGVTYEVDYMLVEREV